ncbi:shikimate kinase [Vulgatibacter incomptus]
MGSGKTRSGLILAKRLGRPFIDLDARIESRAGTSIAQIFQTAGEEAFRELEEVALREATREAPAVIALGGGAVVRESAWRSIRKSGVAVHLHAEPDELARRLIANEREVLARPLLGDGPPEVRLAELARERDRWYARADVRVETTGLSPEEVAGAVSGLVRAVLGPLV